MNVSFFLSAQSGNNSVVDKNGQILKPVHIVAAALCKKITTTKRSFGVGLTDVTNGRITRQQDLRNVTPWTLI